MKKGNVAWEKEKEKKEANFLLKKKDECGSSSNTAESSRVTLSS